MDLRILADGKQYKFPEKLTLGELQTLARDFGVTDPSELDISNILHISGLLFIAMQRENPTMPATILRAALGKITALDFEDLDDKPAEPTEADPTQAADAATDAPAQS